MDGANDAAGSITLLFQRMRGGDAVALRGLWQRYLPRLLGLARRALEGKSQTVADAEDAVQSAFVDFWARVERGDFDGARDRDDLWHLLGVITVRKARKHVRHENAQKRGGGQVLPASALAHPDGPHRPLEEVAGAASLPDIDLTCEELLLSLDEELRDYAVLRLMGYRNREIAERFGCTERKVERKLHLIRLRWEPFHAED
jgi:RNA polymerase sigma factor (sigma-70 family)